MPNRAVTGDELKKLVKIAENQHAPAVRWPIHKDKLLIAHAVKKRHVSVILSDKKRYSIRYETRFGGCIFIKPTNGEFVPCGYISYSRLKEILANESD